MNTDPTISLDVSDVVDRLCQENATLTRRAVIAEATVAHLTAEVARLRGGANPTD